MLHSKCWLKVKTHIYFSSHLSACEIRLQQTYEYNKWSIWRSLRSGRGQHERKQQQLSCQEFCQIPTGGLSYGAGCLASASAPSDWSSCLTGPRETSKEPDERDRKKENSSYVRTGATVRWLSTRRSSVDLWLKLPHWWVFQEPLQHDDLAYF